MKKIILSIIILASLLSCSQKTLNPAGAEQDRPEQVWTLLDHIQAKPGVIVSGDGATASIRIRGLLQSLTLDSSPLFVLNGVPRGRNFAGVYGDVSAIDIHSVRVLKDPADTAIYGVRGANGVILIKTKGTGDQDYVN
jgi:TonB-dependent SusC/RagA subfamily outer membrane receptor